MMGFFYFLFIFIRVFY